MLNRLGYPTTQTRFDALVDFRYHKHRLGEDIDDLLSANNTNPVDWKNAIDKLIGSKEDLIIANDLADLFNKGSVS